MEDQPWQSADTVGLDSFDFSNNTDPSYRVKIEGRLLDVDDRNDDEDDEPEQVAKPDSDDKMETDGPTKTQQSEPASAKPGERSRFSHFFKQFTVDFDRNMGRVGSDPVVEWQKPDKIPASATLPAIADFDVFTFKRNGDETQNITINLFRDEDELFSVSPELYDIIDEREATRQEAVMGVWEYIRALNLQEDEEKRNFRCDDLLRKVRSTYHLGTPQISQPLTDFADCRPRSWLHTRTSRIHLATSGPPEPYQAPLHHSRGRRVPPQSATHHL